MLKKKIFISSERLRNVNDIFRKDVTYDNNKNPKKTGLHPFSRKHIFGKTKVGGSN